MRNYYRVSIAFLVLALGCGQYVTPNATEAVNTPTPTPIFTVTPTNTNMAILVHTATPHPTSETVGKWNLRAGPGTNYASITVIPDGTLLTIEETRGDWLRVIYPGNAGWVHRKAIE